MTTSTTSAVYLHVIEDVIEKVRDEFVSETGPGENVLQELLTLWEMKMMQAGAVLPRHERPVPPPKTMPMVPGVTPVHDLNVPYEGNEEYETPTAEMLFPPTPMQTPIPQTPIPQTPIPTPLPGTADSSMYNIPTGLSDYPTPNSNEVSGGPNYDIKPGAGRSNPYMPPPSPWMNQRSSVGVDVNVAYVEHREESDRVSQQGMQDFLTGPSAKRKRDDNPQQYQAGGYIPQQDGAGDVAPEVFELEIIQSKTSGRKVNLQKGSSKIPQLDGPIPDPYDDILSTPNIYNYQGAVNDDYNVVNTPATDMQAGTPVPPAQHDIGNDDDDDEPPLNENDDDDLDDVDEGEELSTTHLVLAQFDKVTRTKSRWKCTLKDGIMRINHKDILFNKASGEFDF